MVLEDRALEKGNNPMDKVTKETTQSFFSAAFALVILAGLAGLVLFHVWRWIASEGHALITRAATPPPEISASTQQPAGGAADTTKTQSPVQPSPQISGHGTNNLSATPSASKNAIAKHAAARFQHHGYGHHGNAYGHYGYSAHGHGHHRYRHHDHRQ
jgi:hypothetical protein